MAIDENTLDVVAYHEAGHAVVALATELIDLQGSIKISEQLAYVPTVIHGHQLDLWLQMDESHTPELKNHLMAIVFAAGLAAERRRHTEQGTVFDETAAIQGARGDRAEFARVRGIDQWDQYVATAETLLQSPGYWEAVTALARELKAAWPNPFPCGKATELVAGYIPI